MPAKCLRCGAGNEWIEGSATISREEMSARKINALLSRPFWLETLNDADCYERQHDDTDGKPEGFLAVSFGPDGDAYVSIHMHPVLRFRTEIGGGGSPRTRNALILLAEAIRLDNEARPQPFTRKA